MSNAPCIRMIQAFFSLAAIWGSLPLIARAQPGIPDIRVPEVSFKVEYMVDTWQSLEGLPLDTIRAICETPNGYLWIGTSDGLVWFDGYLFHFFTRDEVPILGDLNIDALLSSTDGTLWIGTEGGGLVHYQDGIFRRYNANSGPETSFVRSLYQDSRGVVWVATDDGLFRVRGDHLERGNSELGMPVFNANVVMEDHLGRRWVGGHRLFVSDQGKASEYHLQPNEANSQVRSLLESSDGYIWAGTVDGLYQVAPGQKYFSRVPGITGTILTLKQVTDGEIWAGSTIGGVYRIRGAKVARLVAPDTQLDNVVLAIYRDSNQNFWIGTQSGITRLSRSPMHLIKPFGNQDLAIGTVSLDNDGSLWFTSNQIAHIQGGKVTPYPLPGINAAHARNLLRARDQSLWIGMNGSGVYHITPSRTSHFDVSNGLVNSNVRTLTQARDGSLWIGTESGVSHLDAHGFHNLTEANGLAYDSIRALIEDREGDIWIGTDHGMNHLRGGSFINDVATQALSKEQIASLYQDSAGEMWIGTAGSGLYHYAQGRIDHFTAKSGLVSNVIYSIMEDAKKRLWISTPGAVMLMDRNEMTQLSRDAAQPIPIRIFSANVGGRQTHFYGGIQPAGVLTPEGYGAFPSSHGLWVIHPDMMDQPYRVHIDIEWISVDGHTVPVSNSVQLAAGSNRVEIVYGLQMLGSQQEWRFRYRLDGFDQNWTQGIPGRRGITYTNIPPGRYTVEVESWDLRHPERKVSASLILDKKFFFYQTLWFRIAAFLALFALLALAYYIRIRQLDDRFSAITNERARIAREMHDTLLQGCASVSALLQAATDDELGDHASRLHLVQHASTELGATMDEAREAISGLRRNGRTPLNLVQSLNLMTKRNERKYGIHTELVVNGEPFEMSQPANRALAMIVREAVFNAILHSNAQSIQITLGFSQDELLIEISDDGKGFVVSDSSVQDGYGITGMQERIDSLGGKLAIESTLGKGTSVSIQISRNQAQAVRPDIAVS